MAVSHGTSSGVNSPQHMRTNANKGRTLVSARKRIRSCNSALESLFDNAAAYKVWRAANKGWKERLGRLAATL